MRCVPATARSALITKDLPIGWDLATGIEVGHGGVFFGAAPYLFFLSDSNGTGKCDKQEILLKGLFTGELGSPYEGPEVGALAPNFTLKTQDGKQAISLGQYRNKKPVVLIFGSFT